MKQTRMSVEQYLQIGKWLETWKERIETKGLTQIEIQGIMSGELGFTIPRSSVIRCAKAIRIKWMGSPLPPSPVPLEREAIIILITSLEGLYIEMDKTVPDDLANLHSTYVRKKL